MGVIVQPTVHAQLTLDCQPAVVVRGSNVLCRASAEPAGTDLVVTGWRFDAPEGFAAVRASSVDAETWTGPVALGGTITVTGTVNGDAQEATATISVQPRDWSGRVSSTDVKEVPNTELPLRPVDDSELGQVRHNLELTPLAQAAARIDAGPNEGLFYLTGVPFVYSARVMINTQAMSRTSDNTRLHPETKVFGSACTQDDIVRRLPGLIRAHEGLGLEPHSHTWFYKTTLDAQVGSVVEGVVGVNLDGLANALLLAIDPTHEAALEAAGQADGVSPVNPGCQLRFF